MKPFYDAIRPMFGGALSLSQVDGINALMAEGKKRGVSVPVMAYILATAFHETARTMQAIEEYGRGKGRPYGRKDKATGHAYYGRGHVQLTWKENYEKMGARLGVDLVGDPALALSLPVSVQVIFEGMLNGMFTGRKVGDYISDKAKDYRNARRVVNGTDRADTIAGYARDFEAALHAAGWPVQRDESKPPRDTTKPATGLWALILAFLRAIFGGRS